MIDQTKEKITLPTCPFDISSPVEYEDISDIQFTNPEDEPEIQQMVSDREAKTDW